MTGSRPSSSTTASTRSSGPLVPGHPLEYVFIPAMGLMKARVIEKGRAIRIMALEGEQVLDTVIWEAANLQNVLNRAYAQLLNGKWNLWRPGNAMFSTNCNRLATITET